MWRRENRVYHEEYHDTGMLGISDKTMISNSSMACALSEPKQYYMQRANRTARRKKLERGTTYAYIIPIHNQSCPGCARLYHQTDIFNDTLTHARHMHLSVLSLY